MPSKNEVLTAVQEAQVLIKEVASLLLQELNELDSWKKKKGIRLEDRANSGKSLFLVFKTETTIAAYLGAKAKSGQLGEVVLVNSMKEGLANSDNEYRLGQFFQQLVKGPHGGEILTVLQQA